MTALPAILNPEPSDNEDVVSALETADIFWAKGDTSEALRWLKRAADTASDAGDDMRALAIARSVADLKSLPTQTAAEAPRMSRPPPPSAMPRPAPAAPSASAALSSTSTEGSDVRRVPLPTASASGGDGAARLHTSSAPQKMPPPLPPSKSSTAPAAPSARTPTSPPPAPSHSAAQAPTPAASHAVPLAPTRTASTDNMAAVSVEARAPAPQQQARAAAPAPAASTEPVQSVRRSPTTSSLPKEPHRALTAGTAFRGVAVFVKPQGRNGDKLEVILAKPGQAVPAGAEAALLIPTRRGGRLLG